MPIDPARSPHRTLPRRRRARLRARLRRLRERVVLYRSLLGLALAACAVLALLYARSGERPEPVLLGVGPAGVMLLEAAHNSEPLPADAIEAEPEVSAEEEAPGEGNLPGEEAGEGEASYYGHELAGNRTASGEHFDPAGMTAAHRTLPFGSRVRVTNTRNGRSVVVRINDRGPFVRHRVIDVSRAAAQRLGMLGAGRAQVRLELLPS